MGSYDGAAGGHEFTLGGVIGRAIEVIGRQWPLAIGLAVVLGLLNALSVPLLVAALADGFIGLSVVAGLFPFILSTFGGALLAALLTPRAVGHAFADPGAVDGSAASLAGQVPALFAASLLVALGIGLGMMLLLVPGLILMVSWSVTTPALVVERLGPVEAIGRSRELTRDYRWPIFGLYLIGFVIQLAMAAMIAIVPGGDVFALPVDAWDINPVDIVGSVVGFIVWAAIAIALYIELRLAKEGAPQSRYIEIFS